MKVTVRPTYYRKGKVPTDVKGATILLLSDPKNPKEREGIINFLCMAKCRAKLVIKVSSPMGKAELKVPEHEVEVREVTISCP